LKAKRLLLIRSADLGWWGLRHFVVRGGEASDRQDNYEIS